MRQVRRVVRWASASVAIALMFLVAGEASSVVSPLLVVRTEGIAFGDYHSAATRLAPLSRQVINDANRDALPTPTDDLSTPEPATSPASPLASPVQPQPTPTPAPSVSPTTPAITGSITGTVQDSQTSVGIANAVVSLSPGGLSTLTSSNGAFGFPAVSAGTYTITASAAGYQPASAAVTVTASHNANLNLHLVSTSPAGSVVGVVKSGATGKGVAGATVTLTPNALATITDGSGYFGFASVAPGTYTLTVTAAGYQDYTQTVAVKSGHTTVANVSLTPV